jgi:hypothetical protein
MSLGLLQIIKSFINCTYIKKFYSRKGGDAFLMVLSFFILLCPCTMTWRWPTLGVATICQITNIHKWGSCVWSKTSLYTTEGRISYLRYDRSLKSRITVTIVICRAWYPYGPWKTYPEDEEKVEFSKQPMAWKIILERMIGNVVRSKLRALSYFVLRKAKPKFKCRMGS